MIKRRTSITQSEKDFVEASQAYQNNKSDSDKLDPKAPRKFKSHTLPFNEYEYDLLTKTAEKYGQTHSGVLRYALKLLAEK